MSCQQCLLPYGKDHQLLHYEVIATCTAHAVEIMRERRNNRLCPGQTPELGPGNQLVGLFPTRTGCCPFPLLFLPHDGLQKTDH